MSEELKHYLEEIEKVADNIGYIGPLWQTRLLGALAGIKEELAKLEQPATKLPSVAGRCIP